MRALLLFSLSLFLVSNLYAQDQPDFEKEQIDLAYHADIFVNAVNPIHRERAHEEFYKAMKSVLEQDGSFDFPFDSLHWVSIQYAPDRSFRFISWQLVGVANSYSYNGFYQDATQTLELNSAVNYGRNVEYEDIDTENWYGQLVYEIVPMEDYYFLFGFKQIDQFTKTKVAEVLRIVDGKPVFGSSVFEDNSSKYNDAKKRIVLQYSADALVNLTYNPGLNMLVYDHLVSRMGRLPGQGPTMVPDGTYKGYKYDAGKWSYVDHLYSEISDEKPKSGTKKENRDLFGRGKG